MAENVSALNIFDDELKFEIASRVVLEASDVRYLNVFEGVNGTMRLNTMDSTIFVTTDECDTRNDTGSTVFAGNTLATCPLNIYQSLCNKKLQRYYLGKFGANADGIDNPLNDKIIDEKMEKSSFEIAKIRWQGAQSSPAYASVTGNLTTCDGYLQAAYALSASTVNVAKTALTASNAIAIVDEYYDNCPTAIRGRDDLRLFLSPSQFDVYMIARRNDNNFHFDSEIGSIDEIRHPGTRGLIVTSVVGLDGLTDGTALLTYSENMALGVLSNSMGMEAKVWYDINDDRYKFNLYALMGMQFVYAEHVVKIA